MRGGYVVLLFCMYVNISLYMDMYCIGFVKKVDGYVDVWIVGDVEARDEQPHDI